jgi:hypothetical protein
MDIFVPISIYPDIWCTPGVVSQIPESETKRRDTSGLAVEVKRVKVKRGAGDAHAAGIDENQVRRTRARSCPHMKKGRPRNLIGASARGFERVRTVSTNSYIWARGGCQGMNTGCVKENVSKKYSIVGYKYMAK